jgi:hypothetical protein
MFCRLEVKEALATLCDTNTLERATWMLWVKCESVWQSDWNNEKQFVCSNRASGFCVSEQEENYKKDTRNNVNSSSNQVNRFLIAEFFLILFLSNAISSFSLHPTLHSCFPHCHSALLALSYQNDFFQFDVISFEIKMECAEYFSYFLTHSPLFSFTIARSLAIIFIDLNKI